jgi:hypothetical protein
MVDLHFAQSVRHLAREDLNVTQIAERLHCDEAIVVAAIHMLGLPRPGEHHATPEVANTASSPNVPEMK